MRIFLNIIAINCAIIIFGGCAHKNNYRQLSGYSKSIIIHEKNENTYRLRAGHALLIGDRGVSVAHVLPNGRRHVGIVDAWINNQKLRINIVDIGRRFAENSICDNLVTSICDETDDWMAFEVLSASTEVPSGSACLPPVSIRISYENEEISADNFFVFATKIHSEQLLSRKLSAVDFINEDICEEKNKSLGFISNQDHNFNGWSGAPIAYFDENHKQWVVVGILVSAGRVGRDSAVHGIRLPSRIVGWLLEGECVGPGCGER